MDIRLTSLIALVLVLLYSQGVNFGTLMQSTVSFSGASRETTRLQAENHNTRLSYIHDSKLEMMKDTKSTPQSSDVLANDDAEGTDTFKLLTFNTWGLKYVSKFRKERLIAIGDRLSNEGDYDIIALQEIWTTEDWEYIDSVCAHKYPFRRWFSSGILTGPGLAVLSKHPIKKTCLYRFPINGRPSAFFRGDWYVGKSVAVSTLQLENGSTIALLNSHMHAPYSRTGDAAYDTHRACQAWEIASIVQELKSAGHAVILVGDLNSRPGSLQYNILEKEAGLTDSWELINGKTDLELVKTMDPWEQIIRAGTTCDSILNTWRASRRPDEACRLDYALVDGERIQTVKAGVEFTEQIPGIGSYSDHFAYSAVFRLKDPAVDIGNHATPEELMPIYEELRSLVQEYIGTTLVWQRKWRLWHFFVSMVVSIAFLPVIIVVSYRAPWASILFYFFGCIVFATGLVNGMISFLFGRYELRNLQEVILEVNDRIHFLKYARG